MNLPGFPRIGRGAFCDACRIRGTPLRARTSCPKEHQQNLFMFPRMGNRACCDACRDPGYTFASPYKLPNGQETSKWLLLQVGTSPKTMPIALVSNASILEKEWHHWKDQCNADNKPQLNTHDCDSAVERIKKAST